MRTLAEGGSEHSFGIHVAQMAGMPRYVVERAEEILESLEKGGVHGQQRAILPGLREMAADSDGEGMIPEAGQESAEVRSPDLSRSDADACGRKAGYAAIFDSREAKTDGKGLVNVGQSSGKEAHKPYQLSFIQLDDPLLEKIRDEILDLDINSLTPVQALNKLDEIKRLLGKK